MAPEERGDRGLELGERDAFLRGCLVILRAISLNRVGVDARLCIGQSRSYDLGDRIGVRAVDVKDTLSGSDVVADALASDWAHDLVNEVVKPLERERSSLLPYESSERTT